jgi:LDH2 family malate/lactate/ureidoglycolate dehydrogenase
LSAAPDGDFAVDVVRLTTVLSSLFGAAGVSTADARVTVDSLVAAEVDGVSSHGIALVPLYLERLQAGGVVAAAVPSIVEDLGGFLVIDAAHALGQVSSQMAVELAIARARVHGLAIVTVRHAFHFGTAAFWTRQVAALGMVGFALSNTRPLMPAPGGAQRVVGNNPMSIAFPSAEGLPLVVDMAMSATAMGRIRIAEAKGLPIPEGWATDDAGVPTTSAAAAIKGLLLPAAGPKGFGLAVAIDLLCGALSGGAIGSSVKPLYGNAAQHYDCSHAFIVIDASRANGEQGIAGQVTSFANEIRASTPASDTTQIYAPGDLERARRAQRLTSLPLSRALVAQIDALAEKAGLTARLY